MSVRELTRSPANVKEQIKKDFVSHTNNSVKILCWNINGLGDKLGFQDLHTVIKSHDIIAFVETMKGKHFQQYFPGYQCSHFPRVMKHRCAKRDSGGMLILVSDALHKYVRVTRESDSLVWLQLQGKCLSLPYDVNIGVVYIPPEGSPYADTDDLGHLCEAIRNKSKSGRVFICGDTNARTSEIIDHVIPDAFDGLSEYFQTQPEESSRNNVDKMVNGYGKKLIDLCKYTGLQICNGRLCESAHTCYKYNGESVVDYLLAQPDAFAAIENFHIRDKSVYSDHCALSFSLTGKSQGTHSGKTRFRPSSNPVVYRWDQNSQSIYCNRFLGPECTHLYENLLCKIIDVDHDPRSAADIFDNYIKTAIDGIFRKRKSYTTSSFPCNKWYDDECKAAKRRLHNMSKKITIGNNRATYHKLMQEYKALIQRKKRKYNFAIALDVKFLHERDPQGYWRFWKRHKPSRRTYDVLDAETFTEYYKNLENKPDNAFFDKQFMENIDEFMSRFDGKTRLNTNNILDDILNAPISIDETKLSLKRMKANKAAGTDGIPSEFYKYTGDILDHPLTALFNHVLNTGLYPDTWCEGLINPLHKRESPTLPDNYRKITITPAIGKLFDGILNNRLQFAKECLSMGDPFQNGFKPNSCAIDNIFLLNGIIDKCKANGRPLYTCFIDFKSAFDLINRSALLYKLLNQGCTGKFLSVIQSMFRNARSRVKWGGQQGEIFENMYGVLQGGVLSPNLFNLFLEDLPSYLNIKKGVHIGGVHMAYLLYADDLVLMSESPTGLQTLIHGLENFCMQWHMVVNLTKTNVVVFNERFTFEDSRYCTFNGNEVPTCKTYNYLGVIFSNANGRFRENYENKHGKALRAIYAARSLAHDTIGHDIAPTVLFKIFDTQIQPIIDYSSEVCYDRKVNHRFESLQTIYLKRALGVKVQTSNLAVFGETGRYPLIVKQEKLVLGYWLKLMTISTTNPLRIVYDELYRLSNAGHITWCTYVGELLTSIGLGNIWEGQNISAGNVNQLKSYFKVELERHYTRKWLQDINDIEQNPILRTYAVFKEKHCLENYIQCLSFKKYQQAISRFRVSSHRLGIELGRHQKPRLPVEQRLCIFCNSRKLDDEMHFLIHCEFHTNARKTFFSTVYKDIVNFESLNDKDKFRAILISTNEAVIFALGKFIHDGFKSRDIFQSNIH